MPADAPEIVAKKNLPREDGELDLTPGTLEKTNDPVRMYLREMGTVPLLTREGEVAIAKRIERGQLLVLKTITRAPLILKELLQVGEDLRTRLPLHQGNRSVRRRRTHRRKDRSEDQRNAQANRQVAKLYLARDEAGAEARQNSHARKSAPICTRVTRWPARALKCRTACAISISIRSKRSA